MLIIERVLFKKSVNNRLQNVPKIPEPCQKLQATQVHNSRY